MVGSLSVALVKVRGAVEAHECRVTAGRGIGMLRERRSSEPLRVLVHLDQGRVEANIENACPISSGTSSGESAVALSAVNGLVTVS